MTGDIVAFVIGNKTSVVYQIESAPDGFGRMKFTRWYWGDGPKDLPGVCAQEFQGNITPHVRGDIAKGLKVFKSGFNCVGIEEIRKDA